MLKRPHDHSIPGRPRVARCLIAACCLCTTVAAANDARSQPVIYVQSDANGLNDGSSWCDAHFRLQDALAQGQSLGQPVEIRVAAGVYRPDAGPTQLPGDRGATFRIFGGLTLLGGYAGCWQPDPDERHISFFRTVLDGDLAGDDQPAAADCCQVFPAMGCSEAVCSQKVCTAIPICCMAWSDRCAAAARLLCCELCGNTCDNSHHVTTLDLLPAFPTLMDGLVIRGGNADFGTGGGVYMPFEDHRPTISRCVFEDNLAARGGAVATRRSSGIYFLNCIFRNNFAQFGGALYTDFEPVSRLVNCLLAGNHVSGAGGAVYWEDAFRDWEITNCTIAGNSGAIGGGLYSKSRVFQDDRAVTNTILWGNRADLGPQIALDQYPSFVDVDSLTISHGIVEGGPSDVYTTAGYTLIWETSSSALEPDFVDADGPDDVPNTPDDNYRLSGTSPAIDAGNNEVVPIDLTFDLDGTPRFLDDPLGPDVGTGSPPMIDMGAYEYCFADLFAQAEYVLCLTGPLLSGGGFCLDYDLDGDSHVDLEDFAVFQTIFCGN